MKLFLRTFFNRGREKLFHSRYNQLSSSAITCLITLTCQLFTSTCQKIIITPSGRISCFNSVLMPLIAMYLSIWYLTSPLIILWKANSRQNYLTSQDTFLSKITILQVVFSNNYVTFFQFVLTVCHKCNKYNCLSWKMLNHTGNSYVISEYQLCYTSPFGIGWHDAPELSCHRGADILILSPSSSCDICVMLTWEMLCQLLR